MIKIHRIYIDVHVYGAVGLNLSDHSSYDHNLYICN